MRRISAFLSFLLCAAGLLTEIAGAAQTEPLILLSTQLRPIAEAQKMRNRVLKDFPREVDYITEQPQQFAGRVEAEQQNGPQTIDVVGGLQGELQPLVRLDALAPLDNLAAKLTGRGIPDPLMALGKFGTAHQFDIPWMQASYIMVANKKALPYLPDGADINALSYAQLAAWARTIEQKTGKRLLGFPAGSQGLMYRFFEGFLYPSYTGGVVVPFRSEAAEAMWTRYASLWKSVNPNSTSYDFMQQPLLSAMSGSASTMLRVLDALRQKPDEFVACRPPGPRGEAVRGCLAGLAIVKGAPDANRAIALIDI